MSRQFRQEEREDSLQRDPARLARALDELHSLASRSGRPPEELWELVRRRYASGDGGTDDGPADAGAAHAEW